MTGMELIVSRMAEGVLHQMKNSAINEPVYGLIVCYSTESGTFPPWIAVGTERERVRMTEEDEHGLYAVLWSGDELEYFEPIEEIENDIQFVDDYAAWVEEAETGGMLPERMSALALRVCFELRKVRWPDIFPVTEDFVVLCNDQKCEWLAVNADVLLEEKQRHAWIQKGWLPN